MKKYETVFVILTYRSTNDLEECISSIQNKFSSLKIVIVNSFYDDTTRDEFVKIAIYDPEYKISRYLDKINSFMTDELKIVTSGFEWMDITNNNVHKGNGMTLFQELFNISKDECVAFGDNMNDYELLTSVTYSYAVDNAVQPIKEIAYDIIGNHNDFSVVSKIKELIQ